MHIELAQKYGFCFGVKRAIKIAEETKHAITYGPLIHNKKEINRLQKNFNVTVCENIKAFKPNSTVIIRTHGIQKDELEYLNNQNINLVDATCPFVTKPQEIVKSMSAKGYDIVIFGDEQHPEIRGVKSYATGKVFVVKHPNDLEGVRLGNKIALVAQTTRKMQNYLEIANALIVQYQEVRVFNTICNATFENQDATRALAKTSDVMIVVGGKNSSNTRQLLYICQEHCKDSYLVEGPEDLDSLWFFGKKVCGVTAGASTPQWIIEDIVTKIDSLAKK